jgi:hypothetical protein
MNGLNKMNQYFEDWYHASQIFENALNTSQTQEDGIFTPATAGALALSISYAAASALVATKNPVAVSIGTAIFLIPDPVIFGIGYGLFASS